MLFQSVEARAYSFGAVGTLVVESVDVEWVFVGWIGWLVLGCWLVVV